LVAPFLFLFTQSWILCFLASAFNERKFCVSKTNTALKGSTFCFCFWVFLNTPSTHLIHWVAYSSSTVIDTIGGFKGDISTLGFTEESRKSAQNMATNLFTM